MSKHPDKRKPAPRDRRPAIKNINAATLSHIFHESLANITIAVMVAVVMWSCILGMSEGFQPGHAPIVPPIAENNHGE